MQKQIFGAEVNCEFNSKKEAVTKIESGKNVTSSPL